MSNTTEKTPKGHSAVMSMRHEAKDSLDDFPTPCWATRALLQHVIPHANGTVYEPACNRGYMSRTLKERFSVIYATDIKDYGRGYPVKDFLAGSEWGGKYNWIITNPPFNKAEAFLNEAMGQASDGVALLCRTVFAESITRYNNIFSVNPPSTIAQFSERVPMFRGRVDAKGSTATSYAWFVWEHDKKGLDTKFVWIPPCRKALEKAGDYEIASNQGVLL